MAVLDRSRPDRAMLFIEKLIATSQGGAYPGGWGRDGVRVSFIGEPSRTKFFRDFFWTTHNKMSYTLDTRAQTPYAIQMLMTLPNEPRRLRATEARLKRIYDAAKAGLKGDSLALAAGMTPKEYQLLCDMDHNASTAAMLGRADGEMEHASLLAKASREGDSKASLAILQHTHGWASKHLVEMETRINISTTLEEARERMARIIEGEVVREQLTAPSVIGSSIEAQPARQPA